MRQRAALVRRPLEKRAIVHETYAVWSSEHVQTWILAEIERKQWIYKVISGEREADAVQHDEPEFMILPDTDALNDESVVNLLVIFKDTSLLSTRSLRASHIPLLRRVQGAVQALFPDDVPMMYFHHPPSVWQLHLHVAAPCDILRTTNDMQKVVFLEDVISHLELDGEFYTKAVVSYTLPQTHEMLQVLRLQ